MRPYSPLITSPIVINWIFFNTSFGILAALSKDLDLWLFRSTENSPTSMQLYDVEFWSIGSCDRFIDLSSIGTIAVDFIMVSFSYVISVFWRLVGFAKSSAKTLMATKRSRLGSQAL